MTYEQRDRCLQCDFKVNNPSTTPEYTDPSWCYQFTFFDRDACDLYKSVENQSIKDATKP